jgi:hypothetical protein
MEFLLRDLDFGFFLGPKRKSLAGSEAHFFTGTVYHTGVWSTGFGAKEECPVGN